MLTKVYIVVRLNIN